MARTMTEKIESGRAHARAALDAYRAAHADGLAADPDDVDCNPPLLLDRAHDHYMYERDPAVADEEV